MFKGKEEGKSAKDRSKEKSVNKYADLIEEDTEIQDEEEDEAVEDEDSFEEDDIKEDIYEEDIDEDSEEETGSEDEEDDEDAEDDLRSESPADKEDETADERRKVGKNFYRGLLIALAAGLLLIAGLLTYLWLLLKDYEECLPDNLVSEVMQEYNGSDMYFYEDTVKGSGMKRYRIQDGNRRVATVLLEPFGLLSGFDHQKYRILYVQKEKDPSTEIMQVVMASELSPQDAADAEGVSKNTVSSSDAEEEEVPSLPMTEDEEGAIRSLAEAYVKVYAPFSTIKDIGDLRSKVLSYIKSDTNLYERLKSYHNEWGQNVNGYDFGETEVINMKKTGDNTYECDVESEFRTSSADWGVKRTYDLSYHMEMEMVDGNLLLTSVD